MAKKGETSFYEQRKRQKPAIEELAEQLLDGAVRDRFYDFLSFLKERRMKPCWYATGSYHLNYKGKRVGLISIGRGSRFLKNHLQILIYTAPTNDLERFFKDESEETIREFRANIKYCEGCASCAPGVRFTFLGDAYENVCFQGYNKLYVNPTPEEYDRIRQYIGLRRTYIQEVLAR